MEIENKYKYFAFISYKREDERWAKWLQHQLEHYKLPSNLNGRTDLPKEIRPVFRDQSDLAGGVLADEINNALNSSKYLIVICSPRAAQSEWVGKEVQAFIDLGRTEKIIPFIIGGTAHAEKQEDECFPLALRKLPIERELLGVNINELGQDAAVVKVVSQMLGVKFDELWQRHQREQKQKQKGRITAGILVLLALAGIAFWMYTQWQQTLKINWKMMENQSRFIAGKAKILIEKGDPYTAQKLLLEVLPTKKNDKPCTVEAEEAFRIACGEGPILFKGHESIVSSVSFSPNGEFIASASWDNTIRIWGAQTGKEIRIFNGHSDWVNFVSFSPNGKRIVSASDDKTVRIWDTETGSCVQKLNGHTSRVNSASFSPSGKLIVSTSNDTTVRIWDVKTGYVMQILRSNFETDRLASIALDSTTKIRWNLGNGEFLIQDCSVSSAVFSPDERYVVSDYINDIIIWDITTGKIIRILKGHTGHISSISFSPDGKHILSSSYDKTVKVWDADTGDCILTYEGHKSAVVSAAFSPDGRTVVSASSSEYGYDGIIILWDVKTGMNIQTIEGRRFDDRSLTFSFDGKFIASAYYKTVNVWKVATETNLCFQEEKTAEFYTVAFSPDGKYIVYASSDDKTIKIIEVETKLIVRELNGHASMIYSITFSPDGKYIMTASDDGTIKIWDAETGKCNRTLNGHNGAVLSAFVSPDGKRIVSASVDSTIRIWEIKNGKELMKLKGHSGIVYSAIFSPDGRHIVSTSEDRTTIVWDTKTGNEIVSFQGSSEGPADEYYCSTFTLNGECVTAPLDNGRTVILDIKTGNIIHTLKGYIWRDNSVVKTSDGERIVTTYCGVVKVWDSKTGVEIQNFQNDNNPVLHSDNLYASFSPNGRQILSVNDDGTIRIWAFPPLQELIDHTREHFKDNPLTPDERKMYYLE